MRDFLKKFWPVLLIAAMAAAFLLIATGRSDLQVYDSATGSSTYTSVADEDELQTEAALADPIWYKNDEVAFTMQIPGDWEYVLKDGYDTYVHAASASSIQIQVLSYYPMVNNMTADSIYVAYAELGAEVTEFSYLANNVYYDIYQKYATDGVYDAIEWVIWDRLHVVKVVATFNDSYYDRLGDEIWASIDSIAWDYEDPIDSDLYLVYYEYGDFEFAVPMDWYAAETDGFYAYEEQTGSNMAVTVLSDTLSASEISQVDYANYLASGLNGFILSAFEQGDDYLYGEGTYYDGDVQCAILQKYVTNGTYHYIITWKYPLDYSEYFLDEARRALDLTRVFYATQAEVADGGNYAYATESETEEASGESVFVPQEMERNDEYSAESEAIADAKKSFEGDLQNGLSSESGGDGQSGGVGQADTFADALVTVAGIGYDQAEYASQIWNTYIGSVPAYADGYAVTDADFVVYVCDDMGNGFYMFFSLSSGDLDMITVGDIDGDVVYSQ